MAQEVMLSQPPGHCGGGPSMGAPVEGLGNYKGVMLCNRPQEASGGASASRGFDDGVLPFRSTVAATQGEQLGLGQARADAPARPPRRPQGKPVLKRHMKWLKDLQVEADAQRKAVAEAADKEAANAKQVKAFCEKHRAGVKQLIEEDKQVRLDEERQVREALLTVHRPAGGQKPAWAMTAKAAEEADEEEADDLIDFVENLDFDKYIGDLEFKEAITAVRDRAGKLKREQDVFREQLARDLGGDGDLHEDHQDELASVVGDLPGATGAIRRITKPRDDDDAASLAPSEAFSVASDASTRAKEVLAANPQMRAVHSKASVEKLMERAAEKPAA